MQKKPKPVPLLLQHQRKLAGYTQRQVQELLGLSARIVGLWETGKRSPNEKHCKALATLYECDVADFYDVDMREIHALGRARLREYLLAGKVKSEGERARLIVSLTNQYRNDEEVLEQEPTAISSVSDLIHIYGDPDPDRMRIPVAPNLIPIQEESTLTVRDFWRSTSEIIVSSGPRNCGKTYNNSLFLLWLCENCPGIQIGVCRSEMTGIGETIWESFKLIFLYPYARDPRNPFYVDGGLHRPSKIVFENGSVIDFFGLHSENAQRGKQKHVIFINQVEDQDTQSNYSSLIAAMTGERAGEIVKPDWLTWDWRILMDCNPDIPLHWVYKNLKPDPDVHWFDFTHKDHPRYYDPIAEEYTPRGNKVRSDIKRAYPPGHERQRMLDGIWAGATGLVLNCLDPDKHILPPERQPTIEKDWKHYRTTDWSFGGAHVTLWISTAPDGKSYVWQEYARTGGRVAEHGEFTLNHSRDFTYAVHFADDEDASARAEYGSMGIPTRIVDKDLVAGTNTLNRLLAEDKLFIFEGCNINRDAELINKGYPEDIVVELAQLRYPDKQTGNRRHDSSPEKSCKKDRFDALRYWAVGVHGIQKRVALDVVGA